VDQKALRLSRKVTGDKKIRKTGGRMEEKYKKLRKEKTGPGAIRKKPQRSNYFNLGVTLGKEKKGKKWPGHREK